MSSTIQTTGTISLQDYNNNVKAVTYLWVCGVACPAGQDFNHDTESDGEDYCDLTELIGEMGLWDLEGSVVDGRWEWNGKGNVRDERGNTIYNVKAI